MHVVAGKYVDIYNGYSAKKCKDFECLMKLDVYVIACSIKMFMKSGVRGKYSYSARI